MNITKELLENFGVTAITISDGTYDFMCFLRKIDKDTMTFSLLKPLDFPKSNKTFLRMALKDGETQHIGAVKFNILDHGESYCTGTLGETGDQKILAVFKKFSALEYQDKKYGRRKEERFPIGKEHYKKFGLSSPEQTVFLKGLGLTQPCAILDVSIHGICIVTPFSNKHFKTAEIFNIKIAFVNPDETVVLKLHKVHSRLTKTGTKTFATVSCQVLEPISYLWKTRVFGLIEAK